MYIFWLLIHSYMKNKQTNEKNQPKNPPNNTKNNKDFSS